MVSQRATYFLWFFFGWLGLHHVYLGRFDQALVWFITLGGGCGIGWIRDYWRIPEYIAWCNADKKVRKAYLEKMAAKTKPKCGYLRSTGMAFFGAIVSSALGAMVPDFSDMYETDPINYWCLFCIYYILRILGNAFGLYLVANIGDLQCPFKYPLQGSLSIIIAKYLDWSSTLLPSSLAAWYTRSRGLRWRPPEPEGQQGTRRATRLCLGITLYIVACVIWLMILGVGIHFNGGKVKEAFGEGVGESLEKLGDALKQVYTHYSYNGWRKLWDDIAKQLKGADKTSAYKILGLPPTSSNEEITKQCRKLLAETHPDRFRVQEEKEAAQSRFLEIQSACSVLSSSRSRPQKLRDE